MLYDGLGRRVQKSITGGPTTVYCKDNLASEYTNGAWSKDYIKSGDGSLIATENASGPCKTCYFTYDHLGSVRMVTDPAANVVARHDYLPFGEEIPANTAGRDSNFGSTTDATNKFTGQLRDQESGQDYFNARYFTPALARFNSPDPMNAGANLLNPQSWNAYAYVLNNPLTNTDPTGMYLPGGGDPSCITDASQDDPCGIFTTVGGIGISVPIWNPGGNGGGAPTPAPTPTPAPPAAPLPPGSFPGGENSGLPPGMNMPGPFGLGSNNPYIFNLCPATPTPCVAGPSVIEDVSKTISIARYGPWAIILYALFQPTPMTDERRWELANIQAMAKRTGKEMASDAPSWARYYRREPGESCAAFAARILFLQFGSTKKATDRGPRSEFSQIKKACERGGL